MGRGTRIRPGLPHAGRRNRWHPAPLEGGTITADALSAHDCLLSDGDRIEAGHNSHRLRKSRDDADKAPLLASRALACIGQFYKEEARARLSGVEPLAWRTEHIGPAAPELRS